MSLTLKPTVLIIDDSPDVINLLSGLLKTSYKVKAATSGEKGLTIVQNDNAIDLILLDVIMPGLSGSEVCKQLKTDANTADIPVIFITAMSDLDDELQGLKLGAVDYITKSVSPAILLARVENYLKIKAANDFLKDNSGFIKAQISNKSDQLTAIHDITILLLIMLAKTGDHETDKPMPLNTFYVKALAEHLQNHPQFKYFLTEKAIQMTAESRGTHFDPVITDTFMALAKSFREIAKCYPDNNDLVFNQHF
ncbi:response regulator [Methylobacter psychrophilus]|uniref:response regulator n=1 Tax=Methylobacter psychrophilus TaxID=96941 RepID=UPI0021D4C2CA|nr:response regulator [Methylobacter psychrophilus]